MKREKVFNLCRAFLLLRGTAAGFCVGKNRQLARRGILGDVLSPPSSASYPGAALALLSLLWSYLASPAAEMGNVTGEISAKLSFCCIGRAGPGRFTVLCFVCPSVFPSSEVT